MDVDRELKQILTKPIMPSLPEWLKVQAAKRPEPQLIENLLPTKPGEYLIIAGQTGIGKTNLALNLGFSLATGNQFLNFKCEQSVAGFLALEGDEKNFADRLLKLSSHYGIVGDNFRFAMVDPERPERVLAKVNGLSVGLRVLIIDGARYIIPGDYCSAKDCRKFIVDLKAMLRESGVSAILTLQLNKPHGRDLATAADIYRVKGATELVDDATSVLLIEKAPWSRSADHVELSFVKHRISSDELRNIKLNYVRETCSYCRMGES